MTQEVLFVWIIFISIPFSSTLTNWLKAVSYHCFFSAFSVSSICFCLHVTGRYFPLLLFSLRFHFIGDLTFSRCVPWTWFSVSGWYVVLAFFIIVYCLLFLVLVFAFPAGLLCFLIMCIHIYFIGKPFLVIPLQLLCRNLFSFYSHVFCLVFFFLLLFYCFYFYSFFFSSQFTIFSYSLFCRFCLLYLFSSYSLYFLFFSLLFIDTLCLLVPSISYQKSEYFLICFCTFNPFE